MNKNRIQWVVQFSFSEWKVERAVKAKSNVRNLDMEVVAISILLRITSISTDVFSLSNSGTSSAWQLRAIGTFILRLRVSRRMYGECLIGQIYKVYLFIYRDT